MNALARWLNSHGGPAAKRELQRLVAEKTGRKIRWATIHDIARGAVIPKPDTARRIETASDGAITAAELLGIGPTVATAGRRATEQRSSRPPDADAAE